MLSCNYGLFADIQYSHDTSLITDGLGEKKKRGEAEKLQLGSRRGAAQRAVDDGAQRQIIIVNRKIVLLSPTVLASSV